MMKIAHKKEISVINHLSAEVINVVLEIITVLDEEYEEERNVDADLGGYVLVVENEEDIEKVREAGIDVTSTIPEYVDLISCSDGEEYTNSLILCNNDYSISLIIPIKLTPKELLSWME